MITTTDVGGGRLPPPTPHQTGIQQLALPSLSGLETALGATLDRLNAEHDGNPPREALVAALAQAAMTAMRPTKAPRDHKDNISIADLCRREGFPVPPADAVGDPEELVIRARYRKPGAESEYWVTCNTAGRWYRWLPSLNSYVQRRVQGNNKWESVPASQIPAAVLKLREAISLAQPNGKQRRPAINPTMRIPAKPPTGE